MLYARTHRRRAFPVYEHTRDAGYNPALNKLAAEIKELYHFDTIAQNVIATTPAVSPDEDLRAFMEAVRKVAQGHLLLPNEPEYRNISHFATETLKGRGGHDVQPRPKHAYAHARAVQILTRLCDECIDTIGGAYSKETEKARITKLVARRVRRGARGPVQREAAKAKPEGPKGTYPPRDEHFRMLFDHAWGTFDVTALVKESTSVDEFERKFHSSVLRSTYDSGCAIL